MSSITNGLIVRNISSKGAFDGEQVDQNGLLVEASVDAKQGSNNFEEITKDMDKGNYKEYATCSAVKIIQKGGIIRMIPTPKDLNHCQIHGITIKEANNLFSNHQAWD